MDVTSVPTYTQIYLIITYVDVTEKSKINL